MNALAAPRLPDRVVVLGGSGFVGRALCERIAEHSGHCKVVVPTRRIAHAAPLRALPTVQAVQADVHDDRDLARVLAGCDAVVNLVAILHGSAGDFDRVHVALPRRLAAACRAAGAHRVVHVSALGVGPDTPSNYLRSKTRGEAVLAESAPPLQLTVLRPSVIFGAGDRFLNLFSRLQSLLPLLPLAGGDAQLQPVWVDDVAEAIVRCLADPVDTAGRVYECAGPTRYTLSRLVALAGGWAGRRRPQLPLPAPLGRLQALALEWLPGEPMMSRDNLDSLRVPNVASGRLPGLADLGIEPTALEAVAPGYLRRGASRHDRWRARHPS